MIDFDGRVAHLEDVAWPWANAGGVARTVPEVLALAQTAVGWVEPGSYTLDERVGNGTLEETYYHNPVTGESFNNRGMPNAGLDEVIKDIPEMVAIAEVHRVKLIPNVAPVSTDPAQESVELVTRMFEAGVHGVVLNAGCPHVMGEDGKMHSPLSLDAEAFNGVLDSLRPVAEKHVPIWVRISPQPDYMSMRRIASIIRSHKDTVSAVLTPNTWSGHTPKLPNGENALKAAGGVGSKSGPATAPDSHQQTFWAVNELQGSGIDTISSSGIVDAHNLRKRLGIGAVAGCGSTFYYESGDWKGDTEKMLRALTV